VTFVAGTRAVRPRLLALGTFAIGTGSLVFAGLALLLPTGTIERPELGRKTIGERWGSLGG